MSDHRNTLRRSLLFAFALPAIMQGFMHAPESLVQGIYAKHAGLSLAAIATAIFITRMFDAITYPLIGYLSDLTARRSGSRKPWIVAGTIVTVSGLWLLYRPPPNVSAIYFGLCLMTAYVGWKLTEIPYTAWSFSLSTDYVQRARIQTWRGVAQLIGTLVFYTAPYLSKALGYSDSTEMDLRTLSFTAVIVLVFVPLMNAYSLARVPNGDAGNMPSKDRSIGSLREVWRSIINNRPLLHLLLAYVPVTVLTGMATGVCYLYFDAYLGQGEHLPLLLILSLLTTILGVPMWGLICQHYERHRVWAASLVLGAVSYAAISLVPRGSGAELPLLLLYPFCILCVSAVIVLVPALMGDIVDYGRLQFGENRSGMYAAVFAFLDKSLGGTSAAIGMALVSWLGFAPKATQQTLQGALGIKLVAVILPALGLFCAAVIIWRFPIDRARQAAIRDALQVRDADASSTSI